jgi:prevent-host-death family protein
MDARVLRQIRQTRTASRKDFVEGLGRTLAEVAGGTLTVRKAKDGLSAVLKRAREGAPQVIGSSEDAAVVISVKDLATLLGAAKEPTLADVLKGSGFKPYRGGRIVVGERRTRETLKRRGDASAVPAV